MKNYLYLTILLATFTCEIALSQNISGKLTCLTPPEIDYFLKQDIRADHLGEDSVLFSKEIKRKDSLIMLLKMDKADLKLMYNNEVKLVNEYKVAISNLQIKYTEAQLKSIRRRKVILWTVGLNLAKDVAIGSYFLLSK